MVFNAKIASHQANGGSRMVCRHSHAPPAVCARQRYPCRMRQVPASTAMRAPLRSSVRMRVEERGEAATVEADEADGSPPIAAVKTAEGGEAAAVEADEADASPAIAAVETAEDGKDLQSETDQKLAEADRLRAAEKFMVVTSGEAECTSCGYLYTPKTGDPEYPVLPGTFYKDLPSDWQCPTCGAPKSSFQNKAKTIAGFAENQKYGLGTNSMTSDEKSLLIFGSLGFFFLLFLAGYFIQ